MSVELALRTFPAPLPHVLPGKPGACELHAVDFDFSPTHIFISRPLENLS